MPLLMGFRVELVLGLHRVAARFVGDHVRRSAGFFGVQETYRPKCPVVAYL